jgi:hypothetical protein
MREVHLLEKLVGTTIGMPTLPAVIGSRNGPEVTGRILDNPTGWEVGG